MTGAEEPDRQVRAEVTAARQTRGVVPNPAPLRWATGVFLAFVGARGLVVPQVSNQGAIDGLALLAPTLESFLIVQALLRVAILLAGVALILLAVRPQSGTFATVAQTAAFVVLAWWAAVLMGNRSAAAACLLAALALGIALTAALERDRVRIWARNRHPFDLVMIVAALAIGVLMLVPFGRYQPPVYEPVASQLPWIGATFVIGGTSLLVAELQRQALNVWSVIGRIVIAAAWFAWVLLFLAPFGQFNLVLFYIGFSLVLLLEPVVGARLPRFDATTLRARTSLAMAAAIAVPMLLGMGVVSNFEEYVHDAPSLTVSDPGSRRRGDTWDAPGGHGRARFSAGRPGRRVRRQPPFGGVHRPGRSWRSRAGPRRQPAVDGGFPLKLCLACGTPLGAGPARFPDDRRRCRRTGAGARRTARCFLRESRGRSGFG